jgi:hypothetical protein
MYKPRYIQYINLPAIPDDLTHNVLLKTQEIIDNSKSKYQNYYWSDFDNQQIDKWCKEHICSDMYWGFQAISGNLDKHQDVGTKIKFIYLLDAGGDNVKTSFWDNDQTTLLEEYIIPCRQWHILKADTYHSVSGIQSGKIRFSVTGRIF